MVKLRKVLQVASSLACVKCDRTPSMLKAFTIHKFHESPVQLSTVRDCLIQSGVPLSSRLEDLTCLFMKLDSCGYFRFLKNEKALQESWIILDPMTLYSITNSVLCTLKARRECKTGIIPSSNLHKRFRGELDPQFVCKYLSNMELCHVINDEEDQVGLTSREQHYFIPALLDNQPPLNQIWQSGEGYKWCTGWCLTSTPNPWSFLPAHLLHTLLLHFALPLMMQPQTADLAPQLLQGCFVWKNDIRWLNLKNGIETVIEMTRHSTVTVVMRCKRIMKWSKSAIDQKWSVRCWKQRTKSHPLNLQGSSSFTQMRWSTH